MPYVCVWGGGGGIYDSVNHCVEHDTCAVIIRFPYMQPYPGQLPLSLQRLLIGQRLSAIYVLYTTLPVDGAGVGFR